VDDLPESWNQKVAEYFGIKVPDDAHGVLQDIHWSHGTLGYFPTYSLGNLYAAQIFRAISRDIKDLDKRFADGDFKPFLQWLRQNIHRHGRRYRPNELIEKITGEPLNPRYLIDHLKRKVELQPE
ncbi:MAG TPA: carboxypeptidase M32, partial [Candidatus Saccharimonadales bacterium]|nr:carboxypeptidase M32 [Candidatus Saccharimonadales bacterium]